MDLVNAIIAVIGLGLMIAGGVGYTVVTFRKGLFWGIGGLVLPLISVLFLFTNWRAAWKPFFCGLAGILFFSVAITNYIFLHPEIHQQLKDPFADILMPQASGSKK
jgi:hypothetical protein